MIIDAHVHISLYREQTKTLEEAFALLQKEMKALGVSHAIIIPDNLEGLDSIADLEKAQELIKGHNNFFLLGSPQIIQRGFTELEKYRKLILDKTILGIKFFPGHDPYYPNDERCQPYYQMCEELNTPVLFHTGENSDDSECAKYNDPKYIVEVAKKHPNLKVIITHYYWPKLDYCYEVTKDTPNIYFELAATADEEVLEKSGGIEKMREVLTKTVNDRPDKVMFGTDWPMCKLENHIELVNSLDITDEIKNRILSKNVIEIYNLPIQYFK